MSWPNPPIGESKFAHWCRSLLTECRRSQIVSGIGYMVRRNSDGTTLEIAARAGGGGLGRLYRVQSVSGDYLVCKKYNPVSDAESGGNVNIAKAYELRETTTSTVLKASGVAAWTCTYVFAAGDYDDNRKCTADDSGGTMEEEEREVRYVTPAWESGKSLIWAIEVDYSGVTVSGADLKLLDLNVAGRAWAKEFQPPI